MSIQLDTPVQFLKGVGPKVSEILARKEIIHVGDVLQWFPRSYEDLRVGTTINQVQAGQLVSFTATVLMYRQVPMGRTGRRMHEMVIQDPTGRMGLKWFRVPFKSYFDAYKPGVSVRVTGDVKEYRGVKEIHHPEIRLLDAEDKEESKAPPEERGLLAIYSETEGINQRMIRKIVQAALTQAGHLVEETLPEWMVRKYDLKPLPEALSKVHLPGPQSVEPWQNQQTPYHRRLIFEEFFWMEVLLARSRRGLVKEKSPAMRALQTQTRKLRETFGFPLTDGQEKTLSEIFSDLMKPHPMNRLVQGDVGCGKTIVALLAAALVIENGYQVALMAPTEILAEQHYKKAQELFGSLGVSVVMLSGGLKENLALGVRTQIASGEAGLIVGTHALIQDEVKYKRLGLVIIDEQHRFGVKQRAELKKKGLHPHFLIMTATPIPRTLAMTVYGDLEVSVIREMPKGRQPITTRIAYESKREAVYDFVKEQLTKGRQAYVIYPLVDETEKLDLKNATEMSEVLRQRLAPFQVALLHGRMKSEEKEAAMLLFKRGTIKVLVSTTVVEVGVDVPNANIMVIEHAERFGLAQLHQLRGRVGRGEHKSYCVLLAGHAQSEVAKRRLAVMQSTTDGFKIAEEDLVLRGPGEFLGTRQSGLPGFRMANLVRDVEILTEARRAAFELIEIDPDLKAPENISVRKAIVEHRRPALLFASIG